MDKITNCEDKPKKSSVMSAYFKVEDFLYGNGKNKSIEIKSAMIWGALSVVHNNGDITWDEMRNLYGEFMSKQMNLR